MADSFDIKLAVAVLATVITIGAYFPYLKDLFAGRTKPHLYTWLIWAITQGTASAALLYGGGNFGAISLIAGTVFVVVVLGLSFKFGTKNIARSDTGILILALFAIVVWWQLENPYIAVAMVSAIDGMGYIPTFRKSFREPWTETLSFWILMAVVMVLALVANAEYNFLTVTYLLTLALANTAFVIMCFVRRKSVEKPEIPHILTKG